MSICYCHHCGIMYDQDFDVEHEEVCLEETTPMSRDVEIPEYSSWKDSFNEMTQSADKIVKDSNAS